MGGDGAQGAGAVPAAEETLTAGKPAQFGQTCAEVGWCWDMMVLPSGSSGSGRSTAPGRRRLGG